MQITPLVTWDSIHVGASCWTDDAERVPCDVPLGVRLEPERAELSAPIEGLARPADDDMLGWCEVMEDDGLYRLWYSSRGGDQERLLYAESDDCVDWRLPDLNIVEINGSAANNVCLTGKGALHFNILKDPHADAAARYKCWQFRSWWEGAPGEQIGNDEGHRRLDLKNAARPGEDVLPVSLHGRMFGLTSPDGLHWTPIPEPILDEWHDTHNICAWDPNRGRYVGYFRGFYGGRRAISYAETDDFAHWPATRELHAHGTADHAYESLYSNGFCFYPGIPSIRLMFPGIYDQNADTVYGQLAVSRDGLTWARFAGHVAIPCGPAGSRTDAYVYPEPNLLRIASEGKFRLLCRAGARYHNQYYNPTLRERDEGGVCCWAEWGEDRLAGIRADGDGSFALSLQRCGDRLLANYRTAPDGWIRCELVDRLLWPPQPWPGLESYTFEQSDTLSGDRTHAPVTWHGSSDLSGLNGKPVGVRVRLHKAKLFALTMAGADDPLVSEDPRYPV